MPRLPLVKAVTLSIALSAAAVWAQSTVSAPDSAPLRTSAAQAPLSTAMAPDAPSRYTIKSGDTLWAISSMYLKSPWRWPELWRMNQAEISNPHLIYPGQVLVLTYDASGQPVLRIEGQAGAASGVYTRDGTYDGRPVVKISPQLRSEPIARDLAVPSLPPAELEPFLSRPLVIDEAEFKANPEIVLTDDRRVVLAKGDVAYAISVYDKQGRDWHVYRPSGELRDPRWQPTPWWKRTDWYSGKSEPDRGILGYEATYLGDARVLQFGDIAKIEVVSAKEEIQPKDRLIVAPVPERISYVPHSPGQPVDSVVIKLSGPIAEAGRGSVVAIAAGASNGLEIGHVVSFVRPPRQVANPRWRRPSVFSIVGLTDPDPSLEPETLTLPEERIGLGFVFRVFNRVAYTYILSSSAMVRVGDFVRNP